MHMQYVDLRSIFVTFSEAFEHGKKKSKGSKADGLRRRISKQTSSHSTSRILFICLL